MILILEDDADRVRPFRRVLRKILPGEPFKVWANAHQMIADLSEEFAEVRLISLDHDLESVEGSTEDPGEGLDVPRFLGEREPVCPVIVHSSNRERSDWMLGELELGGWDAHRVAPLGDDWVEVDWRWTVMDILKGRADEVF